MSTWKWLLSRWVWFTKSTFNCIATYFFFINLIINILNVAMGCGIIRKVNSFAAAKVSTWIRRLLLIYLLIVLSSSVFLPSSPSHRLRETCFGREFTSIMFYVIALSTFYRTSLISHTSYEKIPIKFGDSAAGVTVSSFWELHT